MKQISNVGQGMSYKVLHGFQASAGQPAMLARALREIGVDAENVVIGPNKFGYPADHMFPNGTMSEKRFVLATLAAEADVVHIHAIMPFFNKGVPLFPMGTDLLALKAAGKKIVVHFRGSEIRQASLFAAATPYHYVDDDPEGLIASFPENGQRAYIAMCRALADEIVVSDPELSTYVPSATLLPRTIDFNSWKYIGLNNPDRPLVVHAPSRRGVKGTKHIIEATNILRDRGLDFDFKLVENLPQHEARTIFESSDIIVDQLRIGWYGVLAVEGMALGKCVVSYVRDDLASHLGENPPLANANPDTIVSVLARLIESRHERERIAKAGHEYCTSIHNPNRVALRCREVYECAMKKPQGIDIGAYMELNALQENEMKRRLKKATARIEPQRNVGQTYKYYKRFGLKALLIKAKEKLAI